MMRPSLISSLVLAAGVSNALPSGGWFGGRKSNIQVQLGPRPYFLVNDMDTGKLKDELSSCLEKSQHTNDFVIGHRGATLQFPEHSKESYMAAMRTGAGTIECDVAFTSDLELVCRHSHCDLHTTTDIVTRPELNAKCTVPFKPANGSTPATANCCTTDITLAEFKSLRAKMDASCPTAKNATEYLGCTPNFRTDLYATRATVMSHKESIQLINSYGLQFTPEAKTPSVKMPFKGFTQAAFAQKIIDEYKQAGISASRVWPQSFLIDDVYYWIDNEPTFAKQAIYLDERVDAGPSNYTAAVASLPSLAKRGVKIVAPAIYALIALDATNTTIIPSSYSVAAKAAGLDIITWSLDRSGFLNHGGDYYYTSVAPVINNDGDMYTVLDVLARQVKVKRIFTDWPATAVYFANCLGLTGA